MIVDLPLTAAEQQALAALAAAVPQSVPEYLAALIRDVLAPEPALRPNLG